MSTRWYPLYQKGNPQLRVFLPNFWMKIVKFDKKGPQNVVNFACSMEMTKYDMQNYLKKIYKIPVVDIHTFVKTGTFKRAPAIGYIIKDDDVRMAIVTLPPNEKFEFPNLFPEEKDSEFEKSLEQMENMRKEWKNDLKKLKNRPGIPSWFSL